MQKRSFSLNTILLGHLVYSQSSHRLQQFRFPFRDICSLTPHVPLLTTFSVTTSRLSQNNYSNDMLNYSRSTPGANVLSHLPLPKRTVQSISFLVKLAYGATNPRATEMQSDIAWVLDHRLQSFRCFPVVLWYGLQQRLEQSIVHQTH